MSYGYGNGPNPYDQQDARAPPSAAFGQGPRPGGGAPRYNQGPAMGRDDYGSNNVEMASLAQNASSFGQGDPNAILNECREIDRGVDQVEQNLSQLRMLQDRSLNEADTSNGSSTSRQLDALSSDTMAMYRNLTERVRVVKSNPESRQPKNAPQVSRIDRRLKQAIQNFQQVDSAFRKKTQDQMARQYRIVRPDADESEVRAAVEDTSQGAQVFQQALMQSGRQGQARAVLSAVQDRHAALQRIEQQMIELAQLFQDMDTLIIQQDAAVTQIEAKGEEVVENLDKGNAEIAVAVETARKTRRKKWMCLGIVVAIIVVVVIIVLVYIGVTRGFGGGSSSSSSNSSSSNKRSLYDAVDNLEMNSGGVRTIETAKTARSVSHIVVPGVDFDADAPAPRQLARYRKGGRARPFASGSKRTAVPRVAYESSEEEMEKRHLVVPGVDYQPEGETSKRYVIPGARYTRDNAVSDELDSDSDN